MAHSMMDPSFYRTMAKQIIDEAYTILEPLGKGGMATVYMAEVDISKVNYSLLYAYTQVSADSHAKRVELAEKLAETLKDKNLDWKTIRTLLEAQGIPVPPRRVALKLANKDAKAKRFQDEWRYLICLNNKNVIKVFGGGEYKGRHYYVMELMPGIVTKKDIIENFTIHEKLKVVFGAGKGLSFLHKNKIIHRDIKPSNFMTFRNKKGFMVTKVTDLGIAKDMDSSSHANPKAVLGTPFFMSPEQMVSSNSVDLRADIYSLGASLYEFTTGKKPFFQKKSIKEILKTSEDKESPILPEKLVKGFPEKLAGIINCCMARNPEKRYSKVDHFLKDLKAFMDSGHEGLHENMRITEEVSALLDTSGTFLFETKSLDKQKGKGTKVKEETFEEELAEEEAVKEVEAPKAKKKKKPKLDMSEVESEEPKKKGKLGCFLFLIILAAAAGAGHYYWKNGGLPEF